MYLGDKLEIYQMNWVVITLLMTIFIHESFFLAMMLGLYEARVRFEYGFVENKKYYVWERVAESEACGMQPAADSTEE